MRQIQMISKMDTLRVWLATGTVAVLLTPTSLVQYP